LTPSEFHFLLNEFGHDHLIQDDFFISRRATYIFFIMCASFCLHASWCHRISRYGRGGSSPAPQHEHKICGGAHLGSAFVSVRPHDELAMQARAQGEGSLF